MPGKRGNYSKYGKEKIQLAVAAYFAQPYDARNGTAARIAREFGVNERSLRNYIARTDKDGTVKLLTSGRIPILDMISNAILWTGSSPGVSTMSQ